MGCFLNDNDKDASTDGEECDSEQNCDTSSQDDDSHPRAVNCETGECEFLVSNKGRPDNSSAVEESEFREDCIAADKALLTTGEPPPNMLQFEQLENEIYTCAPGEDNISQYILLDNEFEVLAYPDMFPYGRGGYNTSAEWMTKLSLRKYYQQHLLNVDGHFANNIEYLFCAQYATEIKQIKDSTHIALRLKRGRTYDGKTITAGMLKNKDTVTKLVHSEHAYKFLRQVRGSPAYWQHELYELLAMLQCLGIPTWFMTLSAADLHWVEMLSQKRL